MGLFLLPLLCLLEVTLLEARLFEALVPCVAQEGPPLAVIL